MKKIIFTLVILVSFISIFAQTPEKINYQAVARDLDGNALAGETVNVQFDIIQASIVVYSEIQTLTTNQFGLFTTAIGSGTVVSGNFSTIAWGTSTSSLQVTINGDVMPSTQLLSVPYALYSKESLNGPTGAQGPPGAGINWLGTLTTVPGTANLNDAYYNSTDGKSYIYDGAAWQILTQDGSSSGDNWGADVVNTSGGNILGDGTTANPIIVIDNDTSKTNELQTLTFNSADSNIIEITNGNGISLSSTTPTVNQVLTWNGSQWIAQNPGSGADNWGSQTVVTDATLSGNGTIGLPLSGFDGDYNSLSNQPTLNTYTAGTGINLAGNIITNTAPDQTVTISGTGGTSVTGTYPTFTINTPTGSDNQNLINGGKAGNNQTINIQNATGTTFSVADADSSLSNELITSFGINGANLEIIEAGTSRTVPLSSLSTPDGNGIYSGSGSLGSNTIITGGPNSLSLTSTAINAFSVDGNTFKINAQTKRVAIGPASPLGILHAEVTSPLIPALVVTNGNSTSNTAPVVQFGANSANANAFRVQRDGNVGIGVSTATEQLDVNGQIRMRTGGVAGYIPISDASGTGVMTWTDPATITTSSFWNGSAGVIYPTVLSDSVGIGTNTPNSKLHLAGNYSNSGMQGTFLDLQNTFGSNSSQAKVGIRFKTSNFPNGQHTKGGIIYSRTLSNARGDIHFLNNSNDDVSEIDYLTDTKLIIKNSGNIGVGTTSPLFTFHVETSTQDRAGYFINTTTSNVVAGKFGVYALASGAGTGDNIGGWFDAAGGTGINFGVSGQALGSTENRAVYGNALNGTTNYAGYFENGNVYVQDRMAIGGGFTGLSATLKVYNNATGGTAFFYDGASQVALSVLSTGSVTVGATTSVGRFFVQDNNTNTTGTTGSFISVQNLANATNTTAGIRFRTGGSTAINGDSHYKGAIFFEDGSGSNGEGDMIFAVNNVASSANVTTANAVMTINTLGNIGVGTTTPNSKLHINETSTNPALRVQVNGSTRFIVANNGGVALSNVATPVYKLELPNSATNLGGRGIANAWNTYSDTRIKTKQVSINYGINTIMSLAPKSYIQHSSSFKDGQLILEGETESTIGFIAQELYEVVPEAVSKPVDENIELWTVEYTKLIPVLTKAIQEQQKMIEELQKEVEALKNKQ